MTAKGQNHLTTLGYQSRKKLVHSSMSQFKSQHNVLLCHLLLFDATSATLAVALTLPSQRYLKVCTALAAEISVLSTA